MRTSTYTVAQLASKARLTERTLRYYDQIGLLVPTRDDNGYRVYDEKDVEKLQRIILLRSCGIGLADIARVLEGGEQDLAVLLKRQLASLMRQRGALARSIAITQDTLRGLEEFENMNDDQRFEELKRRSVERFEEEYGEEARERYGSDAIDSSNERMLSMSKPAWEAKEELEQRIKEVLAEAMATGDVASPQSRMLADMHAQWIRVHWGDDAYSPQAHVDLARGYLKDPRFVAYYDDACGDGATAFLRDVIVANIA